MFQVPSPVTAPTKAQGVGCRIIPVVAINVMALDAMARPALCAHHFLARSSHSAIACSTELDADVPDQERPDEGRATALLGAERLSGFAPSRSSSRPHTAMVMEQVKPVLHTPPEDHHVEGGTHIRRPEPGVPVNTEGRLLRQPRYLVHPPKVSTVIGAVALLVGWRSLFLAGLADVPHCLCSSHHVGLEPARTGAEGHG